MPEPDQTDIADTGVAVVAPATPDSPGDPFVMPVLPQVRAGHMTIGWRIVTACTWIGVIASFAAIWNASVQLGLSTWWLGARAQPQPQAVRLLPFVAPLLMCIAVFNNLRHLAYLGLVAAAVLTVFGIGDLGRVTEIALLELLVAALAAAVSLASLTGTYRAAGPGSEPAAPQST